jgi:hypothetical protein
MKIKEMKVKQLTKIGFRNWLQSKKPYAIVGEQFFGNCCPIARFLQHATGNEFSVMSTYTWTRRTSPSRGSYIATYVLPLWAQQVIRRVDAAPVDSIPASLALKILDSLT